MAAIEWIKLRGQEFTELEAREASDFEEVLYNFSLEPKQIYDLFHGELLSVGKKMVLAALIPIDEASAMILGESDARIRAVIKKRMEQEVLNASGGIHIS
jgi:hypothetical protein